MPVRPSTAALYYPHTTIRDERLVKNALLLWDSVDCITPSPRFRTHRHADPRIDEALDLITRDHIPTDAERRVAHRSIENLLDSPLAERLTVRLQRGALGRHYFGIHPQKLLGETWHRLEQGGFAMFDEHNPHDPYSGEYNVAPELGLLMMAALADACAGTRLRRITDRSVAYATLSRYTAALGGGEYVSHLDVSQVAPSYDRLVTISLRVVDTDGIELDRLVELRRRELREGGRDLARLREAYLGHIDEYADKLASVAVTPRDKQDIEREFQKAVEDDFHDLRRELRIESLKLFTKDLFITAAVAAGALVSSLSGVTDVAVTLPGIAGVAPLVVNSARYRVAREKALQAHTMSWLYSVSNDRGLPLW